MGHDGPATSIVERSHGAPSRRSWRRLPLFVACAALLAVMAFGFQPATAAQAATIVVTTTNDTPAANDGCSLREAITNANNNGQSGSTECAAGEGGGTMDRIDF